MFTSGYFREDIIVTTSFSVAFKDTPSTHILYSWLSHILYSWLSLQILPGKGDKQGIKATFGPQIVVFHVECLI